MPACLPWPAAETSSFLHSASLSAPLLLLWRRLFSLIIFTRCCAVFSSERVSALYRPSCSTCFWSPLVHTCILLLFSGGSRLAPGLWTLSSRDQQTDWRHCFARIDVMKFLRKHIRLSEQRIVFVCTVFARIVVLFMILLRRLDGEYTDWCYGAGCLQYCSFHFHFTEFNHSIGFWK